MTVKEKGIALYQHEVKGILDNRQSQLRRVIKPQPPIDYHSPLLITTKWGFLKPNQASYPHLIKCPYGQVGDSLWAKETFTLSKYFYAEGEELKENYEIKHPRIWYKADDKDCIYTWKPSIHMPRWASRIDLEIIGVRVERLQDISNNDIKTEGLKFITEKGKIGYPDVTTWGYHNGCTYTGDSGIPVFKHLWDSINGKKYPWDSNCWVWCISFRRIE